MKIFKVNEFFLSRLGLCGSIKCDKSTNRKLTATAISLVAVYLYIPYSSAKYVYEHFGSFKDYNLAIFQFIAGLSLCLSITTIALQRDKVRNVIDVFQAIVDKSK